MVFAQRPSIDFDKMVFVNCGLKGPFINPNDPLFWAYKFTEMITTDVKLSGLTINCDGKLHVHHAHVQSMLWATDRIGLSVILKAGAIYDCKDQLSRHDGRAHLIIRYEMGVSKAIMKAGYGIQDWTGKRFDWASAQAARCTDMWNDANLACKYSPETMVFWKVTRWQQSKLRNYGGYRSGSHKTGGMFCGISQGWGAFEGGVFLVFVFCLWGGFGAGRSFLRFMSE
jgi:hypothetical protein